MNQYCLILVSIGLLVLVFQFITSRKHLTNTLISHEKQYNRNSENHHGELLPRSPYKDLHKHHCRHIDKSHNRDMLHHHPHQQSWVHDYVGIRPHDSPWFMEWKQRRDWRHHYGKWRKY